MSEKEPVLFISDFKPVENKAEKSKIGVILLCLGVATLLPWNFYMSAYGYFMTKLKIEYPNEINNGFQGSECDQVKNRYQNAELCSCNNNTVVEALFNGEHIRDFEANSNMIEAIMNRIEQEDKFKIAEKQADNEQKNEQTYQVFWNTALSFLTMSSVFIMSVICNQPFVMNRYSQQQRVTFGLIGCLTCLAFTIAMIGPELSASTYFYMILVLVVTINLVNTVFQSTAFQMGGSLPADLFTKIIQGQALGGVLANVTAVVCFFASDDWDVKAYIFFGFASAFVVITIVGYKKVLQLPTWKFYFAAKGDVEEEKFIDAVSTEKPSSTGYIIGKCWKHLLAVFLVFTVTLMCFPTLTTEVRAESEFWFKLKGTVDEKAGVVSYPLSADSCGIKNFNEPFLLIMVFLLFNIADWIGRSLNQFKLGLNRENSGNRLCQIFHKKNSCKYHCKSNFVKKFQ